MLNQALRDKAAEYLSDSDARPVFEDEVETEFRPLFNALEYTEYAEDLRKAGETGIHAYFFMGSDFDEDVRYFFKCLHEAGALHAFASIEANEFEGLIYMDAKGSVKTLGKEYRKIMKFADVSDDSEFDDAEESDDLAISYARLEQVKAHWLQDQ
ncbi:MAG TPA: hypothetical protein VIQ03_13365 [Gammaproteobacteria bacterium]